MMSVIFSGQRKTLQNSNTLLQQNYRTATLDSVSTAGVCANLLDRLLSGRSSVQLRPGAPFRSTPVCNSRALSVIQRRIVPLNHHRVHLIRTSGKSDAHWSRIWRVHVHTVRRARIGETWVDHETPPDTRPRAHTGNWGDLE
jgi:hypothetical protein